MFVVPGNLFQALTSATRQNSLSAPAFHRTSKDGTCTRIISTCLEKCKNNRWYQKKVDRSRQSTMKNGTNTAYVRTVPAPSIPFWQG